MSTIIKKYRTHHCRVPGCNRAFSTPQGESLHFHRIHSHRITPPSQRNKPKKIHHNGVDKPDSSLPLIKIKRRRNLTGVLEIKPAPMQVTVKFCPGCGLDLHGVAVGMATHAATKAL